MKAHIIVESSIMETNYCGPTIMETNLLWQPTIMEAPIITSRETNTLWQPTIMEAHMVIDSSIMEAKYYGKPLPKMVDGPKQSILQIRQRVNFKSQGEYCVQL